LRSLRRKRRSAFPDIGARNAPNMNEPLRHPKDIEALCINIAR
jgi:hypothetical protein